jgi:hypothetical protein
MNSPCLRMNVRSRTTSGPLYVFRDPEDLEVAAVFQIGRNPVTRWRGRMFAPHTVSSFSARLSPHHVASDHSRYRSVIGPSSFSTTR